MRGPQNVDAIITCTLTVQDDFESEPEQDNTEENSDNDDNSGDLYNGHSNGTNEGYLSSP